MSINKLVFDRDCDLYAIGFALQSIGELLGADGSEHNLSTKQANGLNHAVDALGSFVLSIAGELCEETDPDPLPDAAATRIANNEIVSRADLKETDS